MNFVPPTRAAARRASLGVLILLAVTGAVCAQTPTPQPALVANKGDTAWMLISTALVLMMSLPGLALFYGGLVRTKNMLSVLTQVFMIVSVVSIVWVFYGYSLTFTNGAGLNDFIGGLSKAFLKGVTPESTVPTFSNGVVIPEYAYMAFQMTFACITPALIVGGFAERIKFSALLVFVILWSTFIYFRSPIPSGIGPARTPSPTPPRRLPGRPAMRRRRRRSRNSTPPWPMPAFSTKWVRSILPVARSSTSMPDRRHGRGARSR